MDARTLYRGTQLPQVHIQKSQCLLLERPAIERGSFESLRKIIPTTFQVCAIAISVVTNESSLTDKRIDLRVRERLNQVIRLLLHFIFANALVHTPRLPRYFRIAHGFYLRHIVRVSVVNRFPSS